MNTRFIVVMIVCTLLFPGEIFGAIADTKHNLSITGTGTVKATSENQICIFCHITHHSLNNAPLWNRTPYAGANSFYSSTTITPSNIITATSGSTNLCLSCHDGTVALGEIFTGGPIQMNTTNLLNRTTDIGADLSNDHPVSINYTNVQSSNYVGILSLATEHPEIKFENGTDLQCTTCHDPHNDPFGKFLVLSNTNGNLCQACHTRTSTWATSAHNTLDSCANCHMPHSAEHPERLLKGNGEEQICSVCHNGNVATVNVMADFNKNSAHPIFDTNSVHEPYLPTNPTAGEQVVIESTGRHVECADCHNPHASNKSIGVPGVLGVSLQGANIVPPSTITGNYQLCFRCHGFGNGQATRAITRWRVFPRIGEQFLTSNDTAPSTGSRHPIGAAITNSTTTIPVAQRGSIMDCTDCHGNENGSSAPHGSTNPYILQGTGRTFCLSCHNNQSLPGVQHTRSDHVVACTICHDPHGSNVNYRLINFNRADVTGTISFTGNGNGSGSCTLSCHGQGHNNDSFP